MTVLFSGLLAVLAAVVGCTRMLVDAPAQAPAALQPCALPSPGGSRVRVQCLELPVPLDPEQPNGASLSLHVSVAQFQDRRAEPDPLVILPPLPGEAASMAPLAGAELRVGLARDLVLVDQRGTGRSHALDCPTSDPEALLWGQQRIARLSTCVSELEVDPRLFTTPVAVEDLERVRQALGYLRWNLFGDGYGARVAIAYARRYPGRVRTLVLEGADMPGGPAGADQAALARSAVEATLTACVQQPACNHAFPDLTSEARQFVADLDAHPRMVALPNPATGTPMSLMLTGARVLEAGLLAGTERVTAALLPWMLHSASGGNLVPLAATLERVAGERERLLSEGTTVAIRCLEDVPSAGGAVGAEEAAVCSSVPPAASPPGEGTPVPIGAPTLLLAAKGDVLADPSGADRLAEQLPQSRRVVLPSPWRDPSRDECAARVMATFVELGTADSLQTTCIDAEPAPRFFVDSAGFER